MPPMPEPESETAHQSPERSFQAPTLPTNGLSTTNRHIFVDAEGRPLSIYVSKSVPNRENVEEQIKEHGGIPVDDESRATIKLGPPGRSTQEPMFSSQWVYDCVSDKVHHPHDTFAYRLGAGNRTTKSYYTRDDDKLLEEFVASKKAEGAFINGNKIYEEFAEKHKQHSAQSWRDRAITLNLTSGPSPYELGKAKRDEARRRQQEKLAADKLMLEVAQQKLLGQKWQAAQHDKSESEQKPIHSPPKSDQQNQQPPTSASSTTQHSYQIVDSDSDEGVKQESPLRLPHHFSNIQQSQQAILVFSDIESTDEEDRFHKVERNVIASRRNNPNSQMRPPKLSTSQPEDKKVTRSQKVLLDASPSPSPSPSPPARSPRLRDPSPTADDYPQQDQDDTHNVDPVNYHDNHNGAVDEVSGHEDPFLDHKDNGVLSENESSPVLNGTIISPSRNNNNNSNNNSNSNSNNNNNSNTDIHSMKNGNSNVSSPKTSDQLDNRSESDTSFIDALDDTNTRNVYKGIGSDPDDSDYSEPKGFKPLPWARRPVTALRTRPATLSPKAKRAEPLESLQDAASRRNARRSLPNRSWNQDVVPSSSVILTKLPSHESTDNHAHSNRRLSPGTPTKDDLIVTQDPSGSPSLPTWRNSPQTNLSIPATLSTPIQDVPASVNQQDEHATNDSQGPTIASDTQEVATFESTGDESFTKDLQDVSANGEVQEEPAVDDWQDEPVVDDLYDNPTAQEPADGLDEVVSFQTSVSDQEISGDLTDEDDIAIEQRILGKKQARHLSPLVSREQRSPSPIPTSLSNTTPKMQEVHDSDDDHQAYELPAKLLSRAPAQLHQTQWSQTVWSTGMSFQFKKMPAIDCSQEGSECAAESSAAPRDVSGPVSRDVSILDSDGEYSQEGRTGSAVLSSRKVDTSIQINVTKTRTTVETKETDDLETALSEDEPEDRAVAGKSEDMVHLEQEKDEEEEDIKEDKVEQRTSDTTHTMQERAHVSPRATSSATPKPGVEQDSREGSVSEYKDVLLDYYLGEGDDESSEKRQEREQLLLYLRDHYRKEIRTLMLHELIPALRSIDILDACSGDFAMARALISKGMTEDTETRFWTRDDDCKLFSSRDEDVKGLLERHSAVELIQRARYLTRTREEAKQFEVASDAMEKSGLLKRARRRFGGRESKRQRLDEDET